jgi:hypothetical protein
MVSEMVSEISELDNASQSTRWAGCVGDSLHVEAVVVAFRACQKHQCAELNRAYSPGAQLADRELRTLEDVVQPCGDARLFGDRGGDAPDVIEYGAAGRGLLALVGGLGDRPCSPFSHGLLQPELIVRSRGR